MRPAHLRNHTTTRKTITSTVASYGFIDSLFGHPESSTSNYGSTDAYSEPSIDEQDRQCGHIFTTYIVPSIMHFAAFIIGFIYFRINENEQLYALMEKVFLAVNNTMKTVSQDRVIRRLKYDILL